MTDPVWRRFAVSGTTVLYVAVFWGWYRVLDTSASAGVLIGSLVGSTVGWWLRRNETARAEKAYAALQEDQRALVDQALQTGQLLGPLATRHVERDLAKARLNRAGASPRTTTAWLVIVIALIAVVLVSAPRHPPLLVTATVLLPIIWAVLTFVLPSRNALTAQARSRLKALSKASLSA